MDALEKTPTARIDVKRVGVSGCSRNGKGALVAGKFPPNFMNRCLETHALQKGPSNRALF
jgi:hypothetical protein